MNLFKTLLSEPESVKSFKYKNKTKQKQFGIQRKERFQSDRSSCISFVRKDTK